MIITSTVTMLLIATGCTSVVSVGSIPIVRWWFKPSSVIPLNVQSSMAGVLADLNDGDNNVDEIVETYQQGVAGSTPPNASRRARKRLSQRLAVSVARECRTKFRFTNQSEANVLVAHKWIHDRVIALPDIRTTDVATVVPLAVKLAFIASVTEVQINMVTDAELAQVQYAQRDWHSEWTLRKWLLGYPNRGPARQPVDRD